MNLEYNLVLEILNALRAVLGIGFLWSLGRQYFLTCNKDYKNPLVQAIVALSVCELGNIIIAVTIWSARFGSAHGLENLVSLTKAYGIWSLTIGTAVLVVGYCCKIRVFAVPAEGRYHMVTTLLAAAIVILLLNGIWGLK
jgi:hypothetical protein